MLSTAIPNQQQENLCAQNQQTLVVPAAAWHALHQQLATLQAGQAEMKSFLKASLGLEHRKRKDATSKLQAAWRGYDLRQTHPIALQLACRRKLRNRERSFDVAVRLHLTVPPPPSRDDKALVRTVAAAVRTVQRVARGFLVRRRVARWMRQFRAARMLQAVARGVASRRRHRAELKQTQLATRIARLEAQLVSERKARLVHEAFLRKLSEAVQKVLKQQQQGAESSS